MRKLWIVLAAGVVLVACSTRPTDQEFAQQCQAYGAKPGTDAFVQCMVMLSTAYDQREATIKAGILAHP